MSDIELSYSAVNAKTITIPDGIEQIIAISEAAHRWADARRAFLSLPAGSLDARACLDALSEAESALAALCAPASPQ